MTTAAPSAPNVRLMSPPRFFAPPPMTATFPVNAVLAMGSPSWQLSRVPSSDRDLLARTRGGEDGGPARWTDRLPGAHTGVGGEAGGLPDPSASRDHAPAPTLSRKMRPIGIAKPVRTSAAMLQRPSRGQ